MKKCIISIFMVLFLVGCEYRKSDDIDQLIGFSFESDEEGISCSTIYPKGHEINDIFDSSRTFPETIDNVKYLNYSGFKNDIKVFQVIWQSKANSDIYKPIKIQLFSNRTIKLIFKNPSVVVEIADGSQTIEKPYVFESGKYALLCYLKGKQPEAN